MEATVSADSGLAEMTKTIGCLTTAILLGVHCDPRQYACAQSYVKALGLNLIETSSGKVKGPLKLSKRGSSVARQYLYLAALRLIQRDPVIRQWYERKAQPHAKIKTVLALVRKLAKALWHVARGQPFQAEKRVPL
jgi:transposase